MWGCFKREGTLLSYSNGIKPKLSTKARYMKAVGRYIDFSNLSGKDLFNILEKLDRGIERGYIRVTILCTLPNGDKRYAYAYIPMNTSNPDKFFDRRFFNVW